MLLNIWEHKFSLQLSAQLKLMTVLSTYNIKSYERDPIETFTAMTIITLIL